jgi:uncharacterized membrane protein required for colicin V production
MIAAVAAKTSSLSLDRLPVGWFDFALLAVIVVGFFRGRKNGMTKEILPMFQWLVTVLLGGLAYEMVGQLFIDYARLGITAAYIFGYLTLALVVFFAFAYLKKMLMPRLTGSNFFGGMEYYMGTTSGVIRYVCMLFFALSLLHAPFYTPAEIAATKAYNARWYGGGQQGYSGNFFPTIQTVQQSVFSSSFTGPLIANYLGVMLISTEGVKTQKAPAKAAPVMHIGN